MINLFDELSSNDCNITNNTINNKCSRCGECCGLFIPFTKKELEVIRKYVKKHNIKPTNRINVMTGQFEARCPFYNPIEHKCNIYEVRPYTCKNFICSRKNWKDKRNEYSNNGDYNGIGKMMASFDDLIFNNFEPIIRYILALSVIDNSGMPDSKRFIDILRIIKREDLLQYLKVTDENGNEYEGNDIKNIK